jgi:hypothetical protein
MNEKIKKELWESEGVLKGTLTHTRRRSGGDETLFYLWYTVVCVCVGHTYKMYRYLCVYSMNVKLRVKM